MEEIIKRLDRIIELMEGKKSVEPEIEFSKANPNADDNELRSRELEVFQMLDNNK